MHYCKSRIHQVLKLISDFSHAVTPHSLSHFIIIINKRHIRVKRHPVFCLLNAFTFSDMGVICPMPLLSLSLSPSLAGELCGCGWIETKPLREWKELDQRAPRTLRLSGRPVLLAGRRTCKTRRGSSRSQVSGGERKGVFWAMGALLT